MPKGECQTPAALYAAKILNARAELKPAPNAAKNIKTATGEAYTERGIQRNKKGVSLWKLLLLCTKQSTNICASIQISLNEYFFLKSY